MSENMKGAIIACIVMLPIFAGIGWASDCITVALVKAIVIVNDADPSLVPSTLIDRPAVITMVAIWALASAIVIGLASLNVFGPHLPKYPEVPDWARER